MDSLAVDQAARTGRGDRLHSPAPVPKTQPTLRVDKPSEDYMLRKVDDRPHSATRILIVEDDGDTAESMARLLTILGYEVAIARDGLHAIAMAPRQGPDFVLLDLGLPGMDGYQVAWSLKQEVECKKT